MTFMRLPRSFAPRLSPALSCLCLAILAYPAQAQPGDRYERDSVRPFVELVPRFTQSPRQRFSLDAGGIGRRPIKVLGIAVNGKPLPASSWKQSLGVLTIEPDENLRRGINRIAVSYEHPADSRYPPDDEPVVQTFIINHQAGGSRVALGSRGELVVDGTPHFVLGGFRSGQTDQFKDSLPSAAAAGFHLVHDYRLESSDYLRRLGVDAYISRARDYLREAHRAGLGVFLGIPRNLVREYDEETLANLIGNLSGEPGLWLWYLYDEPYEKVVSVSAVARSYQLLKSLDPAHPVVLVTNRVDRMLTYGPHCDIVWYDRYPIGPEEDQNSVSPIAAILQKTRQSLLGKPVWPVVQAYDKRKGATLIKQQPDLPKPTDQDHRPNESQLRAQAHLAIAQGSMGVIYYWSRESSYSMKRDTPGIWKSLSTVFAELRLIEGALLSAEPVPELEVSGGHDKVMMWTRHAAGRTYAGLVNSSDVPATITIRPGRGSAFRKKFGDGRVQALPGDRGYAVELGATAVAVLVSDSDER